MEDYTNKKQRRERERKHSVILLVSIEYLNAAVRGFSMTPYNAGHRRDHVEEVFEGGK